MAAQGHLKQVELWPARFYHKTADMAEKKTGPVLGSEKRGKHCNYVCAWSSRWLLHLCELGLRDFRGFLFWVMKSEKMWTSYRLSQAKIDLTCVVEMTFLRNQSCKRSVWFVIDLRLIGRCNLMEGANLLFLQWVFFCMCACLVWQIIFHPLTHALCHQKTKLLLARTLEINIPHLRIKRLVMKC